MIDRYKALLIEALDTLVSASHEMVIEPTLVNARQVYSALLLVQLMAERLEYLAIQSESRRTQTQVAEPWICPTENKQLN